MWTRPNGRHLADDFIKCIFIKDKFITYVVIPRMSVTLCSIDNKQALIQVMTRGRKDEKSLSEPRAV